METSSGYLLKIILSYMAQQESSLCSLISIRCLKWTAIALLFPLMERMLLQQLQRLMFKKYKKDNPGACAPGFLSLVVLFSYRCTLYQCFTVTYLSIPQTLRHDTCPHRFRTTICANQPMWYFAKDWNTWTNPSRTQYNNNSPNPQFTWSGYTISKDDCTIPMTFQFNSLQ